MGILLLIKTCIDDNIISNTFNIKQNKQNKQPSNVILSETNSESKQLWTDDKIIPLHKYNPNISK